jgi:hypothetical protein
MWAKSWMETGSDNDAEVVDADGDKLDAIRTPRSCCLGVADSTGAGAIGDDDEDDADGNTRTVGRYDASTSGSLLIISGEPNCD